MNTTSHLDWISLFLAYIITADGSIHDNEQQALVSIINTESDIDATHEHIQRILTCADTRIPLDNIVTTLSTADIATREQVLTFGFAIAYSDGFIDPNEERILNIFCQSRCLYCLTHSSNGTKDRSAWIRLEEDICRWLTLE